MPKELQTNHKKDKDKINQEYRNGDKAKFHNLSPTNTNQPQTQAHVFKKTNANKKIIEEII